MELQHIHSYQDLSEILDKGDFSEQVDPGQEVLLTETNYDGSLRENHSTTGQVFKNSSSDQFDPQYDRNVELDIQEFFPPPPTYPKSDNLLQKMKQSHRNSQSKNQTEDSVQGSEKNVTEKTRCKNYTKNILGNITRKSIDLMFTQYRTILKKNCKRSGVNYKKFEKYYKDRHIYGPQSLVELFKIDESDSQDRKMKAIFNGVLTKIVRKRYLLYSIKLGKMQAIESYIREKNTHLLYFNDELLNAVKNSGI